MERLTHTTPSNCLRFAISLVLFCMVSFSTNIYAASDTSLFRIKVLQDSVYAGDTIDVEFYIGNGSPGFTVLNLMKQFEIEVATDTSLTKQDLTSFAFDYTSLAAFFGTTISTLTTGSLLNPVLGNLNIKTSSTRVGRGEARIGKAKYIVQDNAAGRQMMKYVFTKANARGLLGLTNPVKVVIDSVLIIGRRNNAGSNQQPYPQMSVDSVPPTQPTPVPPRNPQNPTKGNRSKAETFENTIRVYPNPVTNYIQIDAQNLNQYRLIAIDGSTITSEIKSSTDTYQIDMTELKAGMYLLMLQVEEKWNSYKIIKQ